MSTEDVKKKTEDVKKKAHAAAKTAAKKAEKRVKAARERASKTVSHVREVLTDEELSDRARQQFLGLYEEHEGALEAVTTFIQERPFLSVGLGVFAGMILGRIFRRR